jgi:CDP-diacylglycerol--serine O-phosphatidyltransferase
MAIELRYELAVALIVIAALLDGVDGRLARALRAQSRFGAELDSLADFVNFGVAPAVVVFIWGLGSLRGLGWISVLVFALAMGLRLARFNAMIGIENPKWQANYFSGMPAPAGAITVLLPLYIDGLGGFDVRSWPVLIACYTLGMAALLVSTIPTFSGKLLGERISRDHVLPAFVGAAALVALLVTYPYGTLTVLTLAYLLSIPFSYRRFELRLLEPASQAAQAVQTAQAAAESAGARVAGEEPRELPAAETKH